MKSDPEFSFFLARRGHCLVRPCTLDPDFLLPRISVNQRRLAVSLLNIGPVTFPFVVFVLFVVKTSLPLCVFALKPFCIVIGPAALCLCVRPEFSVRIFLTPSF